MSYGYIYIRVNELWDAYNACKLGKTVSIPDRETTYVTSEIKRGIFLHVIEVESHILGDIERRLQVYFNELNLHIKFNAGTEFYQKEIINCIYPYLDENNIIYRRLSKDQINSLVKRVREKDNSNEDPSNEDPSNEDDEKEQSPTTENVPQQVMHYEPRDYQLIIIEKSVEYFQDSGKGLLIIPCGVGKTLISLWITQKLNSNTILIGVPNKLLLKQWEKVVNILFPNVPYLIVSGGVNIEDIIHFLENNEEKCIVITTYSSAHKVYTSTQNINYVFDMKIQDECHHLTSSNMRLTETTKTYVQMLNIESFMQLSLTATIKQLGSTEDQVISNDNTQYFGEIIDRKCLLWAITEKITCDYVIQTIISDGEELEQTVLDENDQRLFFSAFASLKSIFEGHSHHLLIYSNNKDNSEKLVDYIKMLLDDNYFDIPELYYSNYHSEMKSKDQKEIINQFEKAKYGIITCVYCLGEGWDFPLLDAVVFAENMSSNIRIVQSALRASRKNSVEPNKITKIILPILNKEDWLENAENPDFKKVREVIYQMGLEDITISQKMNVSKINVEKQVGPIKEHEKVINELGDYDDELTQQLRLKTVKRTCLSTTYEKAVKIISEKNVKSKEDYYYLCEVDNRLSTEPEIVYKGKFTNWITYLSIGRTYYDLETCKSKVNEYLSNQKYIDFEFTNITKILKNVDDMFPPFDLWTEYYYINDLTQIIKINTHTELVEF